MTIAGNTQMMHWNQRRSRLPEGYREVDYLESTGAQWIDTGIVPTNATGVLITFEVPPDNIKDNVLFGVRGDTNTNSRFWININLGGDKKLAWGWNYYYFGHSLLYHAGVTLTLGLNYKDSRICTYNNNNDYSINEHLASITRSCFLFCANNVGQAYFFIKTKVRSCEITSGTSIIRSYIPCVRTSDSKPGMYDLCGSICPLTGTPFYINAGAGKDFLWGEL